MCSFSFFKLRRFFQNCFSFLSFSLCIRHSNYCISRLSTTAYPVSQSKQRFFSVSMISQRYYLCKNTLLHETLIFTIRVLIMPKQFRILNIAILDSNIYCHRYREIFFFIKMAFSSLINVKIKRHYIWLTFARWIY